MKLYMVRHGLKERWDKNSPLSKQGIEQAKRLGMYIKNKKMDIIYCSTFLRAKQTLEHFEPYLNGKIPIKITNKIREHDPGMLQTYEQYDKLLKKSKLTPYEFAPEGGESLRDVSKRAEEFLKYLKENHKEDKVLLVSHGRFLRFLILRALGLPKEEFQYFSLHEAAVSTLNFDKHFKVTDFKIDDYSYLLKYSSYERKKINVI